MTAPYHVVFLKSELNRRQIKNPRYSLRAFAQQLEVHPSALSRIMALKQEVSLKCCVAIVSAISISESDKVRFLVSVAEERMHRAAEYLASNCKVALPISRTNMS